MTLLEECQKLLSKKRVLLEHLESSVFYEDFKKIKDQLGTSNARQIIWHTINGSSVPRCPCGKTLKWHPDRHQYRDYCSKRCTGIYTSEIAKQTNLKKLGVDHYSKTQEYRDRVKTTSLEKYGEEHYSQTVEFKNRAETTNFEKFGVAHPAQNPQVVQQMSDTFYKKYGVANPMHVAEFKNKLEQTNIKRYGVSNPLASPLIREKISCTVMENYGVKNITQSREIIKKITESRRRNHYSKDTYEKIHDPDWLSSQNNMGLSIAEIALSLGISGSNLCKIFHHHGIEIKRHFRSAMERDLADYYTGLGIKVVTNIRNIIAPYEIDLWFPDYNLGVELNGAYYHCESMGKTREYHLNKTLRANEIGINLLQFFDWEVFEKNHLIIDKINHIFGLNKSIGARTLSICNVDKKTANVFYDENHLQGSCQTQYNLGLCDKNKNLFAMMSFGHSRYTKRYNWELLRFATKSGYAIAGAADKLVKRFIFEKCKPGELIVSYCNRRWSSGNLYNKLNFMLSHSASPGYYYVRNGAYAGTRNQWQKHLLASKLDKFDPSLSEHENMMLNGYSRIWDCGQLVFIKTV